METQKRALVAQDDEPPAKKASILHGRLFSIRGALVMPGENSGKTYGQSFDREALL